MTEEHEQSPEDVEAFFANLPRLAKQVEKNRVESRQSNQKTLFLFAFMCLIGVVGGVLLQRGATDIKHSTEADRRTLIVTREAAFQLCQDIRVNAQSLNRVLDSSIAATKASRTLTEDEKIYRVSNLESIKQTIPVCYEP